MNISKVAVILSCAMALQAGADQEFFCDAVNGNDEWDGTSATYVSGTVGPKKTIGAAVNLADGTPTVITALPGVYDEGELTDDDGNMARVVITQRNLLIRSTEGKEKTFISGRHAATANGLGEGAVRCVFIRRDRTPAFTKADEEATNTVIRGFTICNGATPSGGSGAGVFCATPDGGGAALLVDCTVSNCVAAAHAGLSRCNAYRTLFVENTVVGGAASCMGLGVAANCVMAFNAGSSVTYNMRKTINCTFAFNEGAVFNGGYEVYARNCVAFGNGDNAGSGGNGYVYLKSSVMAAPSSLMAGKGNLDANSITNASIYQCLSPATGDWRLLTGSPAIGRGQGSYLADVVLPPGVTMTDFHGNPIDTSGTVDCGAVQLPAVMPVGGRLRFGTKFDTNARFTIEGTTAVAGFGAYHYGTNWPTTVSLRYASKGGKKLFWALHKGYDSVLYHHDDQVRHRPDYNGLIRVVPPPTDAEELVIDAELVSREYYVDKANGNDDWDGTSATHESGSVGPKRTLQAMCDWLNTNGSNNSLVNVAPGVYDEGGCEKVESGYVSSNRVYLSRAVGLYATGGPGSAVIKGAPDPVSHSVGLGAFRCVWLNASGFIQGIDLTGGYTTDTADSASRAAAAYMGNGYNSVICDCTISNCVAKDCSCCFGGNVMRVKFFDNHSASGGAFRYTDLYGCQIARMTSDSEKYVFSHVSRAWGCTVDLMTGGDYGFSNGNSTYFFGNLVSRLNPSAMTKCNVATDTPYFADAEAGDYRLGAISPALGGVTLAAYASDTDHAWRCLFEDTDGTALRWTEDGASAGAYQGEPLPMYGISAEGGGIRVEGGEIGEHVIRQAATITVTATDIGRRPFVGFEVNGEMLPGGETSYAFSVSPSDSVSIGVRAIYGTTWYVDGTNGSDANGGGSPANALKHIRAATTNAVPKDVVLVAPGVYGEEEGVQYQTERLDPDDSAPFDIGSRVFVPAGVTVKSLEGPAKTFIVGKASTGDYGLGAGAVRCVKLNSDKISGQAVISGFTITGGRTDDGANNGRADFNAGGVLGSGTATDCVISNNAAGRCGAIFKVTAVRCRIVDNIAKARAAVGRECGFYSCFVDRNCGPEQAIQYYNTSCNTTFGPDNRNLKGGTQTAIINVNSGGQMYNCVLNCYIGNYNSEEKRFFNCVFNKDLSYPKDVFRDASCILASTEELVFDDGRPVIGRNVCVDAGDAALTHGDYWNDLDVDGKARVQNARMDIGACEADWYPVYARNLGGRRLTTVSVPASAQSAAAPHSPLHLPSGTATFRLDAAGIGDAEAEVEFAVTGGGTLTLVIGGETYGSYTAGTQSLRIPLAAATTELAFTYEPGAEEAGEAVISRVRISKGSVLIIR